MSEEIKEQLQKARQKKIKLISFVGFFEINYDKGHEYERYCIKSNFYHKYSTFMEFAFGKARFKY